MTTPHPVNFAGREEEGALWPSRSCRCQITIIMIWMGRLARVGWHFQCCCARIVVEPSRRDYYSTQQHWNAPTRAQYVCFVLWAIIRLPLIGPSVALRAERGQGRERRPRYYGEGEGQKITATFLAAVAIPTPPLFCINTFVRAFYYCTLSLPSTKYIL